jgi:hypothetical protein
VLRSVTRKFRCLCAFFVRRFTRQNGSWTIRCRCPYQEPSFQATTATGIAAVNPEHHQSPSILLSSDPGYQWTCWPSTKRWQTPLANADPVLKAAGIAVLTSYHLFPTQWRADQLDALLVQFYALRDLPASEWGFLGEDQSLDTISSIVSCGVRFCAY